jgi:saccharopine dehydrogenase-like NADP-dependent oxidoreductase
MHDVLLLGAGKIGRMIAALLAESGDYRVLVADADAGRLERVGSRAHVETLELDATDRERLTAAFRGRVSVISALSFRFNPAVAEAARDAGLSYFDLTEDVATTREVRAIAASAGAKQIFMPQCGLAPGFISIVANHLARSLDRLDTVHMRVGALPQFPANALRYNLTWSTDGLINEYCNSCEAIVDGEPAELRPLDGLEHFWLHGVQYEAFNTSGGLGTLAETLAGKVRELDYKTIRYPGHQALMRFLISDLKLSERRELLKDVLEKAIPVTFQDLVVTFCAVTGWRRDQLVQVADARRIYSRPMYGESWSAIQITTAAGVCAALDLSLAGKLPTGFVRQEQIDLDEFLNNRFGRLLRDTDGGREAGAERERT